VRPSSAKAKGRRFQQHVRDRLTTVFGWEEGDCESRSMGAGGTDLLLSPRARRDFPFAIECKNVESINVHAAFAQATENAGTLIPLLCFTRNRTEPMVALRLEDFLQAVRK
jgi:hypothetical protein